MCVFVPCNSLFIVKLFPSFLFILKMIVLFFVLVQRNDVNFVHHAKHMTRVEAAHCTCDLARNCRFFVCSHGFLRFVYSLSFSLACVLRAHTVSLPFPLSCNACKLQTLKTEEDESIFMRFTNRHGKYYIFLFWHIKFGCSAFSRSLS